MWMIAAWAMLGLAADGESPLSDHYGFQPLEIVKVSERTAHLIAGDFNSDGRIDLIAANNAESRLDVLIQRDPKDSGKGGDGKAAASSDVNAIPEHWRFELRKIPVDHEVTSLTTGDFNSDGRIDVAYFGQPDQLVVRFQDGAGGFGSKWQMRLADVPATGWSVAGGDLTGDGKSDLAIITRRETVVLTQQAAGTFGPPKRLLNTSEKLGLLQIADLDGDGLNDLCYLAGEGTSKSLAVRLQRADHELAAEFVFDLERPRAVTLRDVDPRPGVEILVIDSRTGRLKLFALEQKELGELELPERLTQFGLGKTDGGKERDLQIGDVDGDGSNDVVTTDPEGSRLMLFRQRGGQLDLGTPYPALAGVDQLRLGDVNRDGKTELIVQSTGEKILGVSRFEQNRLTFPQAIDLPLEPAGIELVDLTGDGTPELAAIAKSKKGRDAAYALQVFEQRADGEWKALPQGGQESLALELKNPPERMRQTDLNGDGRKELMLFFGGSKPPTVLSQQPDGAFQEMVWPVGLGLGNAASAAAYFSRLNDKPGVLVAQESFARNLQLDGAGRWQVGDQFTVPEGNARIVAAATAQLHPSAEPEIVMIDTKLSKLRVLRWQETAYLPWKEIDLPDFNFRGLQTADLNSDGRQDVLVLSSERFGVLYAGGRAPSLKELASFESRLERIFPTDVVAGDLNGDGRVDLAITDVRSHFLEVLDYRPKQGLRHALYFRVFEQKTFSSDDSIGSDPREALAADVTGDGKQDLILLSHDRLLIYPQDAPSVDAGK